jgi:hypothetical protein
VRCDGSQQVAGRDYGELFAPTAQSASFRMLIATAAAEGKVLWSADVCTAYLNIPLEAEEIYVRPPPEAGMQTKVWRLQKALYGLKQAARAWYGRLHEALCKEGFWSPAQDPCLFVRGTGEAKTYMLIHVDDAAVCGTATHAQQGIDDLAKHFRLKDQGEMTVFIGQEVTRNESGIHLRQARYAPALTERFGMWDCAPKPTPMQPGATPFSATDLLDAEDLRKTT